jgi:hypothetical protein
MASHADSIKENFSKLADPIRQNLNILHDFNDILVLAICGILAGADHWVSVETFGKEKKDWFKSFLKLENGIPSHDVFSSVFSKLSTELFQECFISWVSTITSLLPGEVVPIDGKTVRRSHDSASNLKAAHVVSAWANDNKMVLGQVKTEEKSNEITAIPKLLKC